MKQALITGITGQDGPYLAKLLLEKGYQIYGTSRALDESKFLNLKILGIQNQIKLEQLNLNDYSSVVKILTNLGIDEVYNLSGQSSVGVSFEKPYETFDSINNATLNLLEAIRTTNKNIKLFNAGSSECFGNTNGIALNEATPLRPCNPYGAAKTSAFWAVSSYREAYNIFVCTGILFNHESPLRPEKFVTQKIIKAACEIAAGRQDKLHLGNTSIERDWGWAPEYVEAMWLMLQQERPEDYILASGHTFSLEQFIEISFSSVGLNAKDYVISDPLNFRPTDIKTIKADPSKALRQLGWEAKYKMPDVVRHMIESYQQRMS